MAAERREKLLLIQLLLLLLLMTGVAARLLAMEAKLLLCLSEAVFFCDTLES